MRGLRKNSTLQKLDRTRVLPFYLTQEQIALYDQDIYKYLIHLLRCFPEDIFHITQFLLLQFWPLIIRTCGRYKDMPYDWTDILAFGRYSFMELILRFDLNSTLYFKTYIPLALDRACNDLRIYDQRRKGLLNAIRLDQVSNYERDAIMQEHTAVSNLENSEYSQDDLQDYKDECLHFVERNKGIDPIDKYVFLEHYMRNRDLADIAKGKKLTLEDARSRLARVLAEVKVHLRENL